MSDSYTEIKEAIIRLLKEKDPEPDVFMEEIRTTQDSGEGQLITAYYFIDLVPAGNTTVDGIFTDRVVLVDVAYYKEAASNGAYLKRASEMDEWFRPVFRFAGRAVTVRETASRIVDHVLHYTFRIEFRDGRPENKGDMPLMGELETEIKGE